MAQDPRQQIDALEKEVAELRRELKKARAARDPGVTQLERDLMDTLPYAIHVVDRDLVLVHVNSKMDRWCSKLGLDAVTVGNHIKTAYPFIGATVLEEYQQVFATGEPLITQENTDLESDAFHTETHKLPVTVDGEVCQVVTIVNDVRLVQTSDRVLKNSELRYHAVVQSSPMGMHMYTLTDDDRLVFTGANPAADRILGVSHDQFDGQTIDEAFPALADTEIPQRYREVVQSGNSWTTEQVNYEDARISGAFDVLAFRSGPNHLTVQFLDITARLRAEAERERLLAILESTTDVVAMANPDQKCIYLNKAGAALVGWSTDELPHKKITELHPPDEAAQLLQVTGEQVQKHGLWSGETTILGADGTEIPVSQLIMAHLDDTGELAYYSTVIRDLRQIRQVETSLQIQRDLGLGLGACNNLDEVLHLSLVGAISILGMDAGGVYLVDPKTGWMNLELHDGLSETFVQVVNRIAPDSPSGTLVQRGEPLFTHYDDITDPTDVARNTAGLKAFAALPVRHSGRVIAGINVASHTRDATTDHEQRAAAACLTLIGEAIGRKLAEEALRRSEHQLVQAQKMEAVGRLAGGVAHDFNNLLAAIQVTCELMEEEIPEGTQLREDLDQIMQTSERGANLVRQLLAFGGRKSSQPVLVSLNDIVRSVHKMLHRLIGDSVELLLDLAEDLDLVVADPGQLEQVLVNLTVNAGEAMRQGGTLTVATMHAQPPADLPPDHEAASSYVVLRMQDTGAGMSPETQERIFEPFYTTKEPDQGTGLGLSIVYSVARDCGGFVKLRTAPGKGATFELWLPKAPSGERAPDSMTPTTRARLPVGTETLLLVEDDVVLLRQTARVLQQYGYNVLQATSGSDALAEAEQSDTPIQLLLSDIVMPDTTGTQLAETLALKQAGLKVLLMSGHIDPALTERHSAGSGTAFLPKPFDAITLVQWVRKVLDS